MNIKKTEMRLCPCCMEEHKVFTVEISNTTVFKNISLEYPSVCYYCDNADEYFADECQLSINDITMKDAYRNKTGLLTSAQIKTIREKYGISQSDLCLLLGWGGKTITRYESHQVQDIAHDTILRKLDADPEWFLQLLYTEKNSIPMTSFEKYYKTGIELFEKEHDQYLKSAIKAKYARFVDNPDYTGNKELSLDVVVDMINYFANSPKVTNLYLVKLMKLLWYADALSYKRYGHSMSGLVYRALPMGAVPVAYESIVDLSSLHCEEIEMGDGTAYWFLPTKEKEYQYLTLDDEKVIKAVINKFGKYTKNDIVETMHMEDAYIHTSPNDIIQFELAKTLSIS